MSTWPGAGSPLIRLLGECRIGDATRPRRLLYRKGWALLAYLAIERPRSHRRSLIAAMFWPDLPPSAALTNLRQVLADLNRAIVAVAGEGVLLIDRESVRLCPDASLGLLDIDLLEPVAAGRRACVELGSPQWLQEAGELLEGISLEQCDEFCEWLPTARAWTGQRLLNALQSAGDEAVAGGSAHCALGYVRRQIALDPWNEAQQRRLMSLYQQLGETQMALDCYRLLEHGLRQELAVEPQLATRLLARDIARCSVAGSRSSRRRAVRDGAVVA